MPWYSGAFFCSYASRKRSMAFAGVSFGGRGVGGGGPVLSLVGLKTQPDEAKAAATTIKARNLRMRYTTPCGNGLGWTVRGRGTAGHTPWNDRSLPKRAS